MSTQAINPSHREFIMKGGKSKADSRKADSKLAVKKKGKNVKDPNKPKRPPSAFFVFMEQFRKEYKEKHPKNKSVATVGKAAGDKWKSLSEKEKAPYIAKAEQRKEDYNRQMEAYDKKMEGGGDEEESDKSKSEVNDDEEDGSGEEEEDDE
ncbi:HMG1/2-like protein isoform X1 [Ipomoea triloba]|uniref:HMG1/2-like protein isoform X1 n=2 Tax=Ipomoea triloba TaxID=35885 RepID=UPI00125E3EA2|nr:HMG1/2-like protein isoform X1 [Ipomoea triloba]